MGFNFASLKSFLQSNSKDSSEKDGVIGVDIGSSAVKIVQLHDVKGVPTLETYGELQLGPYEGVELGRGTHLPVQKSSEALIDILREAGATSKDATVALSYNASLTTVITIPTLDPERIGSMIPVEAKKYIPISLAQVSLDWFPLVTHKEEKVTDVLITAIYNESLTRYQSIMKGSGLNIITNEVEIFSVIRSVLSPKDETVAILDFGALSTRMYIVKKGVVSKTHSVLLSGTELTNMLAEALKIEFKVAEELKRTVGMHGMETDPRAQKAIVEGVERGLRELHMVMKRYEGNEQEKIDKIILCGSGSLLKGFDTYIQDMFSCPVTVADPFSKVTHPAFLQDTLKQAGPTFAVAVGVALYAFQKQ